MTRKLVETLGISDYSKGYSVTAPSYQRETHLKQKIVLYIELELEIDVSKSIFVNL